MELSKSRIVHFLEYKLRNLLLIIPAFLVLSGICAAEYVEEMEVLHMLYSEKELFSTVTNHPKPLSQIAENITIVTAKEIEAMNAHSVAEVLNRIPGLFVNFNQGIGSLGSTSLLHVQGSDPRHVLIMVDGIPWNSMTGGTAETYTIPVGIIDRIEIIKGPASSSWGASLGGVIHIITQSPGYTSGPTGNVQTAYGERDTQDHRAEISGRADRFGYYLFGGQQASDGPGSFRSFESDSYYSNLSYTLSDTVDLGLSIGYSRPDTGLGDYTSVDIRSSGANRNLWSTVILDAALTRELTFNLRLFRFEQETDLTNIALGLGYTGARGDIFQKSEYVEQTSGVTGKLAWEKGIHTAVFGVDFNRGDLDQTINSGQILQAATGAPAKLRTHPDIEKTGVYLNDTIVIDRLSVTPGIRYDHNSVVDSFLSPSLGLTYNLVEETILRGSVSRGFTTPPLSWTSGGALFLEPNPSLANETIWSYQVGLESAALRYVWLKGTLFRHEVDDIFVMAKAGTDPASFSRRFVNNSESRRQGLEIEGETLPVYHLSLKAGYSYVDIDPINESGAEDINIFNIGFIYDLPDAVRAELFGHYIRWDAKDQPGAEYDTFIWDLNVNRRMYTGEKIGFDLFFTAHNLFDGSQYLVADNRNPDRWLEAGMRMRF